MGTNSHKLSFATVKDRRTNLSYHRLKRSELKMIESKIREEFDERSHSLNLSDGFTATFTPVDRISWNEHLQKAYDTDPKRSLTLSVQIRMEFVVLGDVERFHVPSKLRNATIVAT